jgi:hypothetical protein
MSNGFPRTDVPLVLSAREFRDAQMAVFVYDGRLRPRPAERAARRQELIEHLAQLRIIIGSIVLECAYRALQFS